MNMSVDTVYNQARSLSYDEQLSLLERLVALIRQEVQAEKADLSRSLLPLAGLGAEHWRGVNIDAYLKDERAW
jgi:hypothetical protein